MNRTFLVIFLFVLARSGVSQEINVNRFKSLVRQEQAKIPITMSLDTKSNQYVSTGGIYKSIAKPITEKMPFGFEFDGKHLSFEPLDISWDTGEVSVIPSKDLSTMTKVTKDTEETIAYSKSAGITYSIKTQGDKWRKVVTIDTSVLSVPKGAKYLVLSFLVDTDFQLPEGRTTSRHELVDDCWIEPAKAGIQGSTEYVTIEQEFTKEEYRKYIPVALLNGIIETDADVTFGSAYVFNTADSIEGSACALDSTHFVAAYSDLGNVYSGTCVLGTLSGTEISFGSEAVFDGGDGSTSVRYIDITALSSTKFVVVYKQEKPTTNYGMAVVGSVSDTSISYGSKSSFNSAETWFPAVSAFSDTKVIVAYTDVGDGNDGTARIGTISSTSISFGSEYDFAAGGTYNCDVDAISSNQAVIMYTDNTASSQGTACIATFSSTSTLAYGTSYAFNSGTNSVFSRIASLGSSFIVVYWDQGNSSKGTACIGVITGTDISFGSEYVFNNGTTYSPNVCKISSTKAFIVYRDNADSNKTHCVVATISGNSISYGDEILIDSDQSDWHHPTLSGNTIVVSYGDNGNSRYGTSVAGLLTSVASSNPFMGVAF